MELKRYWQIISRYWWIVAILTLVGVFASYQYYKSHPPTWQAKMVVNIRQKVVPNSQNPQTDRYFADVDLSSEYATDDFTHIVVGNVFLSDVSQVIKQQAGLDISPEAIQPMLSVARVDRELIIQVNDATQDKIVPVVQGLAAIFKDDQKTASYLNYGDNVNHPIVAEVLDLPGHASQNGGRTILLAAIYVIVGLLAGIAITFLLAYLDDTVRTPGELRELTGLPVLGTIPRYKANSTKASSPGLSAVRTEPTPNEDTRQNDSVRR